MSEQLMKLSSALADIVAASGPGIVRIDGRRRMGATGIVWTPDTILTANHVVRRDSDIGVGLPDGESASATVVGRDPSTDLAVLRVEGGAMTPLAREDSPPAVGHIVLALGRPGRTVQATFGIVSALGEAWRTPHGGQVDHYLQTDVVMYPGFSGGPLVNANGKLVGLNTSGLVSGVSLALPTMTLTRIAQTLHEHGRVARGYLGVSTQRAHLPAALAESLGQKSGLLLVSVEPDSPADQAGLTLGDTIINLDGEQVSRHEHLVALLAGDRVGQSVHVRIVRGGEVQKLPITIGERT